MIGRTGPGTRQVVGFGHRSTGRGYFGGECGVPHCNQWEVRRGLFRNYFGQSCCYYYLSYITSVTVCVFVLSECNIWWEVVQNKGVCYCRTAVHLWQNIISIYTDWWDANSSHIPVSVVRLVIRFHKYSIVTLSLPHLLKVNQVWVCGLYF